jgi:hypothetical protein
MARTRSAPPQEEGVLDAAQPAQHRLAPDGSSISIITVATTWSPLGISGL